MISYPSCCIFLDAAAAARDRGVCRHECQAPRHITLYRAQRHVEAVRAAALPSAPQLLAALDCVLAALKTATASSPAAASNAMPMLDVNEFVALATAVDEACAADSLCDAALRGALCRLEGARALRRRAIASMLRRDDFGVPSCRARALPRPTRALDDGAADARSAPSLDQAAPPRNVVTLCTHCSLDQSRLVQLEEQAVAWGGALSVAVFARICDNKPHGGAEAEEERGGESAESVAAVQLQLRHLRELRARVEAAAPSSCLTITLVEPAAGPPEEAEQHQREQLDVSAAAAATIEVEPETSRSWSECDERRLEASVNDVHARASRLYPINLMRNIAVHAVDPSSELVLCLDCDLIPSAALRRRLEENTDHAALLHAATATATPTISTTAATASLSVKGGGVAAGRSGRSRRVAERGDAERSVIAYVIPAFELRGAESHSRPLPRTRSAIRAAWLDGTAGSFQGDFFPGGHSATDHARWLGLDVGDASDSARAGGACVAAHGDGAIDRANALRAYDVVIDDLPDQVSYANADADAGALCLRLRSHFSSWTFEPFLLAPRALFAFDARFTGYGKNKMEHTLRLWSSSRAHPHLVRNAGGMSTLPRFRVLPHGFVVARPHARSCEWQRMYGPHRDQWLRWRTQALFLACARTAAETAATAAVAEAHCHYADAANELASRLLTTPPHSSRVLAGRHRIIFAVAAAGKSYFVSHPPTTASAASAASAAPAPAAAAAAAADLLTAAVDDAAATPAEWQLRDADELLAELIGWSDIHRIWNAARRTNTLAPERSAAAAASPLSSSSTSADAVAVETSTAISSTMDESLRVWDELLGWLARQPRRTALIAAAYPKLEASLQQCEWWSACDADVVVVELSEARHQGLLRCRVVEAEEAAAAEAACSCAVNLVEGKGKTKKKKKKKKKKATAWSKVLRYRGWLAKTAASQQWPILPSFAAALELQLPQRPHPHPLPQPLPQRAAE